LIPKAIIGNRHFGVEFKTKPQLAVDMLQDIAKQEQIPFGYVLADSVYANSPEFVEAVEALITVTYLLQVPEDTLCWVKNPCTITKTYKYNGQVRTKKILSGQTKDPIPACMATVIALIISPAWLQTMVAPRR
jgi:SRSO17 transposase